MTARSRFPGPRRASTAARRSRATACTAERAPKPAKRPRIGVPPATSYTDTSAANGTTYYYKVSAVNAAAAKARLSNEVSATPDRGSSRRLPAPDRRQLQPRRTRTRSPTPGAGRTAIIGPPRAASYVTSNQLACSVVDDLHRLAQQRPVRARRRGLGARSRPCPATATSSASTRACRCPAPTIAATCCARTRRAGPDEVWLERFNGGVTSLLDDPAGARAGDTHLAPRQGHDARGLAQQRQAPGRGSASSSDSTYATAGSAGIGLRGTTGRLDDFGARTLGSTRARPAPRPPSQAIAGDGQVALSWTAPSFDGGSQITGYRVYRGTSPNRRACCASGAAADELHGPERCQRHDLLLQGVGRER